MGGFTHSETVVLRRSVWYLLLMLVVGLFAYGMYRSADFLEKVVSEPRGSRNREPGDPPQSYSQYEEVISIHTPKFIQTAPPPSKPPKPVYPITRTLTNDEGKTVEVEILSRPDQESVRFRRLSDDSIFTISVSILRKDDRKFLSGLPLASKELGQP